MRCAEEEYPEHMVQDCVPVPRIFDCSIKHLPFRGTSAMCYNVDRELGYLFHHNTAEAVTYEDDRATLFSFPTLPN